MNDIATAIQRVKDALQRRPDMAVHEETGAIARWEGGVRFAALHPDGRRLATDMPTEIGGNGDEVTPGWLFRAGLASCSATTIALGAAAEGIELTTLEVELASRSDVRGLLRIADEQGREVGAGPCRFDMKVKIAARNATPERLRALVETYNRCAPVASVVERPTPVALDIEVVEA
jgi:uncharacterized OsmC-like protein